MIMDIYLRMDQAYTIYLQLLIFQSHRKNKKERETT